MNVVVSAVVEGHGDRESIGVLVRRLAQDLVPGLVPLVPSPLRVPRDRLVRDSELERYIDLAARKVGERGGVLLLLDADDHAPCILGPELRARAETARPDKTVAVVLAKHEYENWFIAAAESVAGERGLDADLTTPDEPESIRGAKEWLSRHMGPRRSYRETVDQPALSQLFDIGTARQRSDSFDKCCREIARLLVQQ